MRSLSFHSALKQFALSTILCIFSLSVYSQGKVESTHESVIELKNFSEEKMLPAIKLILKDTPGVTLKGYCIGQDLVVFSYDENKFPTAKDVAILLEDKGYIAYFKENMTSVQVNSNCKNSYKKVKE